MMGATSVEQHSVVSANYRADDYPKTLTYSEGIYRYIGESDLTLPNALAQYFYVDPAVYPDGFNLTALRFGGYGGENPVIEIYNGSASISTASLLQKVDYSFFGYNFDLNLKEQLYFAPGSAFWVVAKFPAGQNQPLGVGLSTNDGATKQYSFYSCDGGNSWTQLSEVLREADMTDIADVATFDVYAVSKNPDWSSVLVIDPREGTVRPGESQAVKVENDGQKLVNGTYKFNLFVNANEDLKPQQKVQATLTVSGYAPELASAQMIDFGDLLVGQEKTLDVEIVNNGYGDFTGQWGSLGQDNIASSSDQFKVPTYAEGFSARSTGTMEVTFAPTRSGSHSGTITLTDAELPPTRPRPAWTRRNSTSASSRSAARPKRPRSPSRTKANTRCSTYSRSSATRPSRAATLPYTATATPTSPTSTAAPALPTTATRPSPARPT